jgi:hypothetical protein
MTSTTLRKISALSAAILVTTGVALISAPGAQAAQSDMVLYLDRTYREVIDVGAAGDSHGDITVTHGNLSATAGGKNVGTYATSQLTAIMTIPGGPQNRKTDMTLVLDKGTIYTTSLVAANGGTPPKKPAAFAIIGGTGKYIGAAGELTLNPTSDSRYKATLHFVR